LLPRKELETCGSNFQLPVKKAEIQKFKSFTARNASWKFLMVRNWKLAAAIPGFR
jgi:hypothetical protein